MRKPFLFVLPILFLAAHAHGTEQGAVNRCANIVRAFHALPEKDIPPSILAHAKGLAIITVVKAGFIFSGKGGNGVVVARSGQGWTGPSFIGTGGAGWGFQAGAEVTDFVFVLNNDRAVHAFAKKGNLTLGADVSVAAGPVGRDAAAGITPTAAIYTYSRTKGLFAGAALEGAVLITNTDANARYYGQPVYARDILDGRVPPPKAAAALRAALQGE